MALDDLSAHLTAKYPDGLTAAMAFGELSVTVPLAALVDFVTFLRDDPECRFSTLIDITAVDYPERPDRFDVVYHFLSMYRNHRIRVKVAVGEADMVPSIHTIHAIGQLGRARGVRHVRHPVLAATRTCGAS